jgi:hypothetical protein
MLPKKTCSDGKAPGTSIGSIATALSLKKQRTLKTLLAAAGGAFGCPALAGAAEAGIGWLACRAMSTAAGRAGTRSS